MTSLVRKATIFSVCGLLAAGVAMANVPDPANSECNSPGTAILGIACNLKANVFVVGNTGGVADPLGEFCVTVRDFNNVPIENSSVIIDFSDCDLQLCTNQLDPGVIVDCVSQTVRKLTDASGVACFRVQGKSRAGLGCAGALKDCVQIFADGVLLCTGDAPTVDLVSQNGEDGVNGNDASEVLKAWLLCGTNPSRVNYDCTNQVVDGNDNSQFLKIWLLFGASATNCAGPKDPGVGPKCP